MDSINYAKKLVEEFDWITLEDAMKAVQEEANDLRNDPFTSGRRLTWPKAYETAYEHVRDWLRHCDEYVVRLDYEEMARFAFSHRKACVWAVLMAKAKA